MQPMDRCFVSRVLVDEEEDKVSFRGLATVHRCLWSSARVPDWHEHSSGRT